MDDDELRRGMPTSHVKFGENVAILAGDALFAGGRRAERRREDPMRVGARSEADHGGRGGGMVGGQYIDVTEFDAAAKGDWEAAANLNATRLRRCIRSRPVGWSRPAWGSSCDWGGA